MALNLRQVEVFTPYANEFPEHLLLDEGADDSCIAAWQAARILRVAKLEASILGVYAMLPGADEHTEVSQDFRLLGVVIDPRYRRQGLGRWLTGHAIGVAESKGGRRVLLAHPQPAGRSATRMFSRMGFTTGRAADAGVCTFDLIPE